MKFAHANFLALGACTWGQSFGAAEKITARSFFAKCTPRDHYNGDGASQAPLASVLRSQGRACPQRGNRTSDRNFFLGETLLRQAPEPREPKRRTRMVPMRNLLVLSAAVSALALVSTHQVAALSPGVSANSPHGLVHKAQKSDNTPGAQGKDATPGAQGKDGAQGAAKQNQRSGGSSAQNKGDQGSNKSDRGANMRSSEKSARGGRQGARVDVNVNRGRHGQRDRADRRTRVGVAVDRGHRSRRDVDVGVRSYGYSGGVDCKEIVRRYRQCFAR